MSIVEAKIQTVEDMYRLIWTAIANRQPIRAIYKMPRHPDDPRLLQSFAFGYGYIKALIQSVNSGV